MSLFSRQFGSIRGPFLCFFAPFRGYDFAVEPAVWSDSSVDWSEFSSIVIRFARVDGIRVDGNFTLMELELIEPYLFLGVATSAVPDLVRAFVDIANP